MIRISSDSTCDLGSLVEKHGIDIMPLKVILDTETYYDGVDITPQDIFSFVEKTKILPKTSAASEMEFAEYFQALTENGDEVVHFNISAKSSGSHNAATQAAVRKFQSIFNLAVDGIVGKATWYNVKQIYNAVKKFQSFIPKV